MQDSMFEPVRTLFLSCLLSKGRLSSLALLRCRNLTRSKARVVSDHAVLAVCAFAHRGVGDDRRNPCRLPVPADRGDT
jgi:hypothetical protein